MTYQRELTWRDAIERVLKAAGEPMSLADIAEEIARSKHRTKLGATPTNTISAQVTIDIKSHGDASTFRRFGPGMIGLRSEPDAPAVSVAAADPQTDAAETTEAGGVVRALGMFWRRDRIDWKATTKLMGQQQTGSTPVDFAGQRGVYLLHDGRETVYVGRSTDRPLGRRLFEHTADRLNGRWDRFSWFGLLSVDEDGHLHEMPSDGFGDGMIIEALEAVLIEALEPPLNRRRGDRLQEVEYLQAPDPALEERQMQAILAQAMRGIGRG